jgi:hypothetical protein
MKTLDQIEPCQPVSAPGTLDTSGSYYLINDIVGSISINADDVDLDMNGFRLDGGAGSGIDFSNRNNIRIHNGTIINGDSFGALLATGVGNILVENLRILDTGLCINMPNPLGTIRLERVHCEGTDVEGVRIFTSAASGVRVIINDSIFRDTDRTNQSRPALNIFNVGAGPARVTITNNRIYDNPRGGIGLIGGASSSGVVMDNQVFGNGATGIVINGDFVVARNVAQGNGTNYDLASAPNAAPISSFSTPPGPWDNISE